MVHLVSLVWFIWFVLFTEQNKLEQLNKQEQPASPLRSCHRPYPIRSSLYPPLLTQGSLNTVRRPRISASLGKEAVSADSGRVGGVAAWGWAGENTARRRNGPGRFEKVDRLGFLPLENPEAPERRELRHSCRVERVGWVGSAGMIRPDIDLADHTEPRLLKGNE